VTRIRARQRGFDSWQGQGSLFFLFATAFRPVLGPPSLLSSRYQFPPPPPTGREADHTPSSSEVKNLCSLWQSIWFRTGTDLNICLLPIFTLNKTLEFVTKLLYGYATLTALSSSSSNSYHYIGKYDEAVKEC
jgi:hypothetical protein